MATMKKKSRRKKKPTNNVEIPRNSKVWAVLYADENNEAQITEIGTLNQAKKLLNEVIEGPLEPRIVCFPLDKHIQD